MSNDDDDDDDGSEGEDISEDEVSVGDDFDEEEDELGVLSSSMLSEDEDEESENYRRIWNMEARGKPKEIIRRMSGTRYQGRENCWDRIEEKMEGIRWGKRERKSGKEKARCEVTRDIT